MLDNTGIPVWFRPLNSPNLMNTDFQQQSLNGKPVLTFWQGTLATPPTYTNVPGGSSEPGSCFYILDNTYRVIKTVTAQYGFTSDVHEFLLTPANTALLLSTRAVPMNLTAYGGPSNGYVQDFAVQEIDLRTNAVVFFWDALTNIPLVNSYEPASSATSSGNVWDAYHLPSGSRTIRRIFWCPGAIRRPSTE
jgi:Arylsulfotransferase (ASST)